MFEFRGSGLIAPKIKPVVWSKRWNGTRKLPDCIKIHSVRGYLTQQILVGHGEDAYSVGDPGLLLPHLYSPRFMKKYKFGIIPHFPKINDEFWVHVAQRLDGKVIDFRTKDYKSIIDEMLSCEIILSQGLHGLILSDAYQIPNVWVYNDSLHAGGKFKFYDYFSSVGRPFDCHISADDLMDRKNIEQATFRSNTNVVSKLQDDIVRSFKEALSSIF